jgi:hypothetical protein
MKLVSFYCDIDNSNFYKNSAIRLKKQCDDLYIPNLILEENFGNEWIDNVRAKPEFLLRMMNLLNEDFLWLDVDCNIHKKIDFELDVDWMSDLKVDDSPHDYVHFIKNTQSNKDFIIKWMNEINEQKRGSHTAFIRIYKELNFSKIPGNYVSIGLSNIESKANYFDNNVI